MKLITNLLMSWVVFHTYDQGKFLDKINSLPKSTVQDALKIEVLNTPYYIMYWQDE